MRRAIRRIGRAHSSGIAGMARFLLAATCAVLALMVLILHSGSAPVPVLAIALATVPLLMLLAAHAYGSLDEARGARDYATERLDRLEGLLEHSRRVSASLNLSFVLDATASQSAELLRAKAARVWLMDPESRRLSIASYHGASFPHLAHREISMDEGPVGEAARLGVALTRRVNDVTVLLVPMRFRSQTVGVLDLELSRRITGDDVVLVEGFASQAGTAIEAARLCEDAVRERVQAEHLSLTDALTGLKNRRSLDLDLEKEFSRSDRHNRPLTLVMVDIDHFKDLNDQYGHPSGDQVLREVSASLRRNIRTEDEVYRFGGEEFAILLPDCGPIAARPLLERLRQALESEVARPSEAAPPVTASFGAATSPGDAPNAGALLRLADAALYSAKGAGRNRVILSRDLQEGHPGLRVIEGW